MTRELRVLFVNENIGGHATVHHHLRKGFARLPGINATFLDVPPPGLLRRLVGARVPGLARLDLDLQPLRAQLAQSAWVRRRLHQVDEPYDVLHIYTQNAALLSTGVMQDGPTVVSLDTTTARNGYRLPYRSPTSFTRLTVECSKLLERRVFNAATTVVANSVWAAESLEIDYGIAPATFRVIPFGVEGPADVLMRDRTPRVPRIGFVGRQFVSKGGGDLLDVFQDQLQGVAELLLITQEPITPAPGVTVVSDLKQGDTRLWPLLASCDIFAFPSPIDQAPNAVLESMAAGLPAVATNTAAVGEMVIEGESGFLIAPGDRPALARALRELIEKPEKRRQMGRAARRRFESTYDYMIGVVALGETLTEAAAAGRRSR